MLIVNVINENNAENLGDAITLSIRTKKDVAERFREASNKEEVSQGDLLEKLINQYSKEAVNTQKLLIKSPDMKESKTIVFEGTLLYSVKRRNILESHFKKLKNTNMIVDNTNQDKKDEFIYSLDLYLTKKNKYLIYENLGQINKYNNYILDILTYHTTDSQSELFNLLSGKIYRLEYNKILSLTSEEIILDV